MAAKKDIFDFCIDGLCCAPCTPFNAEGDIDVSLIPPYIDHMVQHGISFAFVNGSTGEGLSMMLEERKATATAWVEGAKGKLKGIIVHVGAGGFRESMELARHAEEIGADAIACVGPTYFKPAKMEDYIEYMKKVADAAPNTPFYLYDIDFITGIYMDCNQFFHDARKVVRTLRGVKHTTPSLSSMQKVMLEHGEKVDLILGNEEAYLAGLALGIRVTVCNSYAGNVLTRIRTAFDNGDMITAREWQNRLIRLGMIRDSYNFAPACSSRAFALAMGVQLGRPRLPLADISKDVVDKLRQDLEAVGFFSWEN